MPRVYEVARELGVSSREILERLEELGVPATAHTTNIDDATVERLKENGWLEGFVEPPEPEAVAPEPEAVAPEPEAEATAPTRAEPKPKKKITTESVSRGVMRHVTDLPSLVVVAFLIAIVIKTFLVQAFFIPSGSMIPTLHPGDRVIVEKVSFHFHAPRRGEVIVFAKSVLGPQPDLPWYSDVKNYFRELLGLPTSSEEDYIKRVVAVGGDTIRYAGSPRRLAINGEVVDEPYINHGIDRLSSALTADDCTRLSMDAVDDACRVPAGRVFVMGDNRNQSEDSRFFGPIKEDQIVGKAFAIIWPPGDFGGV